MVDATIIVPVHNVREYLPRCLDSLCGQTLRAIQICVVDDGSTDGSCGVAERFAQNDSRVQIIRKARGGPGSARNAAIPLALGRYVLFVDSDDWLDRNAVEGLVAAADGAAADVAIFGAVYENWYGPQIRDTFIHEDGQVVDRQDFGAQIYRWILSGDRLNSPCWKLYRTELLRRHGILFPTAVNIAEDLLFNAEIFTHANRVVAVNRRVYHYWRTGDGLTSRVGMAKIAPYRDCCLKLFDYLRIWGIDTRRNRETLATRIAVCTTRMMFEAFQPLREDMPCRRGIVRTVFNDGYIRAMAKRAVYAGRSPRERMELFIMKTGSVPLALAYGEAVGAYRVAQRKLPVLKA